MIFCKIINIYIFLNKNIVKKEKVLAISGYFLCFHILFCNCERKAYFHFKTLEYKFFYWTLLSQWNINLQNIKKISSKLKKHFNIS